MSDSARKYILKAVFDLNAACNVVRHSDATQILENGAGVRDMQQYLGHADLFTMQVTNVQLKKTYNKLHPAVIPNIRPMSELLKQYKRVH